MSPEEMRLALAEIAGWTAIHPAPFWSGIPPGGAWPDSMPIPQFCLSLDALSPLEAKLTEEQRRQYGTMLWNVGEPLPLTYSEHIARAAMTKPEKRCVCLLRAHGLYREEGK